MRLDLLLLAGLLGRAAWRARPAARVRRVLRFNRVVADLDRAEAFYRDALGFRRVGRGPADTRVARLLGIAAAEGEEVVLQLGAERLALLRFRQPPAPYPAKGRSDDPWFQHLAVVVRDMGEAFEVLSSRAARAISTGGLQRLPPSNGSVTAFKFRDPDGHPLELIHFPPGQGRGVWQDRPGQSPFLGIDHTGLVTGSTARSLAFYRRLGFLVVGRSRNSGPAQERLDGLEHPDLRISSLRPDNPDGPGLELLDYRPPSRRAARLPANGVATEWVTVAVRGLPHGTALGGGRRALALRDPDGHRLLLVDQGGEGATSPALGPTT
ncbi:VOC family protein [Roseomonas nepalensis]|uniref:VOC family protein n=1 Tax=Muricoccus nepalensis TaxID=1854500 RepID=A0A502GD65_9PROT|nr:VOC family protein [Roseomonas nepalensis]TPG58653.1 VOC family protein [Roseomonas nepalensis]